jgi:hypothetical protein
MRFKVTGNHKVAGVDPGRTVDLDESDQKTQALLRAGHLTAVKAATKTKGDG